VADGRHKMAHRHSCIDQFELIEGSLKILLLLRHHRKKKLSQNLAIEACHNHATRDREAIAIDLGTND
jgi:hypothetical protein